jgi:hypothetical protein
MAAVAGAVFVNTSAITAVPGAVRGVVVDTTACIGAVLSNVSAMTAVNRAVL